MLISTEKKTIDEKLLKVSALLQKFTILSSLPQYKILLELR